MQCLTKARLITLFCLVIFLSLWTSNCLAQDITIQNKVSVLYNDSDNNPYGTESNLVITPYGEAITNVRVIPLQTMVRIDGTFSLGIAVESATNLRGFQFDLLFDPNVLEVVSISEGTFLNKDGTATFWLAPTITPGKIDNAAATRLGTNTGGVSGTGTLVVVQFRAKKVGTSTIDLQQVKLINGSIETILVNVFDGTVSVIPPIEEVGAQAENIVYGGTFTGSLPQELSEEEAMVVSLDVVDEDTNPTTGYVDVILNIPTGLYASGVRVFKYNNGTTTECIKIGTQSDLPAIKPIDGIPRFTVDTINMRVRIRVFVGDSELVVITPSMPCVDLWVTKEGPAEVLPGEVCTYTVSYGNRGNATAEDVKLSDQFPNQMQTVVRNEAGYILIQDLSTNHGTWSIGSLPPDGTHTFALSIRIRSDASASSTIINTMKIESSSEEINWANNYATATIHVGIPDVDLWVTKQCPTEILPGEIATYTISYGNRGNATATGVYLSDQFPDQMQGGVVRDESGYILIRNTATNHGTWSIGSLPPDGTHTFALSIRIRSDAAASSTIVNTMKIGCSEAEADYTNNYATATMHVRDTDMAVSKSGPWSAVSGQNITYTIYYRNQRQSGADNVTITDCLPPGLRHVSDTSGYTPIITGSGTLSNPQVVTWNLGKIDWTWWWRQLIITAKITDELPASPTLTADINNVVKVTSTSSETDYTNNQATCTTRVEAVRADLYVHKYGPTEAVKGYSIDYHIDYANYYGNISASNVELKDYLPQGVEYATDTLGLGTPTITGSVSFGGQVLTWHLGTVAAGWAGHKNFSMTALIGTHAASFISNVVEITTDTPERSYANNRATSTTRIESPLVDLVVYKSGQNKINPGEATIKYWIRYSNHGNISAGSVTITDTLPAVPATWTVAYESDTSGLTHAINGNQITWFAGTLTPSWYGKSFELIVKVENVPGSTTLKNQITITSPDSEGDSASCTTHVSEPEVDLEIKKWGTRKALPGEEVKYTIQYRNLGTTEAGSTTITDILPQGLIYGSDTSGVTPATATVGTHTVVKWEFGSRTLTGYQQRVLFDVFCRIATNTPPSSELRNVVGIHTISQEKGYDNNTSTCTTEVLKPEADLTISKDKYLPYEVTPGCELKYRIRYSNYNGNIVAVNTIIRDILPGSVTFVSCTGNGTLTPDGKEVIWQVGTVTNRSGQGESDGSYYLIVRVHDNVYGSSSIVNVVEITTDTQESKKANNRATCTVNVVDHRADVSVSKEAPYDVVAGKSMRYTIRYDNYYGNVAATNTIITDTLPSGLTYGSDTSGLPLTSIGNTLKWKVGTLLPRTSKRFYLTVQVDSDIKGSTSLTNRIEISTDTQDYDPRNNISSWKTHISGPEVDIRIQKSGPRIAAPGQEIKYRLTCRNQSQNTAEMVRIVDILPEGVTYVSDTSGITPLIDQGQIVWQIENMTKESQKYFDIVVRIGDNLPASVTLTNIVDVTADNNETNYTNNRATWTTHLEIPEPDLTVRKWQRQKEVTAGQGMTYYIKYENQNTGDASRVMVTDYLPDGVSYVSDESGFSPIHDSNKVIWSIGTVSAKSSKYFELKVLVDKAVPASTTLTNVIEITTPDMESNASNNRSTCTTHVLEPIADMTVYKFGHEEVLYGTNIAYTINYSNNSSSQADGVVIVDTLDPQVIYESDTCPGTRTMSNNEVRWELGNIKAWDSGSFKLSVYVPGTVKASSTLTNIVKITTLTKEDNLGNNQATHTTHVDMPKVDVKIHKWGDEARPGFKKTYHITYENRGTEKAEDVVIVDKLPTEVTYEGSLLTRKDGTTLTGNYNPASHTVTWNIGDLDPQTTEHATIDVRLSRYQQCGVNLCNYIKITTISVESNYINNECIEIETVVTSVDPNDKLVTPQGFCQNNQLLDYTIHCENMATAGASAILISITDRLDPNVFDLSTFMPGEVEIGGQVYSLDNFDKGSLTYSFDPVSGTATWFFDFHTGVNGLPPNETSPEGEGYVTFKVRAKAGLTAGTRIENKASIIFDYNDPMDTPLVVNVVDLAAPSSTVSPLAATQSSSSFGVGWIGTDTIDGSTQLGSISTYSIYVSDNADSYTLWLQDTIETASTWTGKTGHSYAFYSVAKDRAGNIEDKLPTQEAKTTLTLPEHFVLATLTTTEMYVGKELPLTVSIYDSEGNPVVDYVGTASLQDKLGSVGTAIFNGTDTWSGTVTIPQMPNGGTDTITVEAAGVTSATSNPFLVLIDRYVGGTVTLFTLNIGTTTAKFGTGTFFQDFYVVIKATPITDTPKGGVVNSAREITAYNMIDAQLSGTFTNMAYLEIPYADTDQNGFVDGTTIKEDSLRIYVWKDNGWKVVDSGTGSVSGVDSSRNVVWCNINHLTTFMPLGIMVSTAQELSNVIVYPNPFKPNSGLGHESITFGSKKDTSRALTPSATIKIYTVSGDLVKTLEVTPQDNGQKVWYADNDAGNKVASGVYIYLITNPQDEKCIGKLAIIR